MTKLKIFAKMNLGKRQKQEILSHCFKKGITWKQAKLIQLKKCQKGELEAFGFLYDNYIKKIYDFIYYKTHHQETAEDLTNATFMKALENIRKFNLQEAYFPAWLYKIARNTVIDHYRTQKNHNNIDDAWDIADKKKLKIKPTISLK